MHDFAQAILKHIPIVGRPTEWSLSHTIFQPLPFIGDPTQFLLSKLVGIPGWYIFKASVVLRKLVTWGTSEVAQRLLNGFGYDLILPGPGTYRPRQDVIPLMLPTVYAMGGQQLSDAEIKILGPHRSDWYLNDGIVNTASMNGPLGTDVFPISGFLQKNTPDERRGCYWHFGVNGTMDHADEIGVWVEETTVSVFVRNAGTWLLTCVCLQATAMVRMYEHLAMLVSRLKPKA